MKLIKGFMAAFGLLSWVALFYATLSYAVDSASRMDCTNPSYNFAQGQHQSQEEVWQNGVRAIVTNNSQSRYRTAPFLTKIIVWLVDINGESIQIQPGEEITVCYCARTLFRIREGAPVLDDILSDTCLIMKNRGSAPVASITDDLLWGGEAIAMLRNGQGVLTIPQIRVTRGTTRITNFTPETGYTFDYVNRDTTREIERKLRVVLGLGLVVARNNLSEQTGILNSTQSVAISDAEGSRLAPRTANPAAVQAVGAQ